MNNSPYLDLPCRTLARAIADISLAKSPLGVLDHAYGLCLDVCAPAAVHSTLREVTAIPRSRM
jgi:hypothetical protein